MPRGNLEKLSEWKDKKKAEQKRRAKEQVALLPDDLAEQILEAAEREKADKRARIEEIDAELEQLEEVLAEAVEIRKAASIVRQPAPQTREKVDGTTYTVTPRARRVKGPEAIEAGKKVRQIKNYKRALKQERHGRRTQIKDILKVEAAARRGIVTGLLAITSRWRNSVNLTGLQPRVKMGNVPVMYTDPAGNPLSEEALGPDGEPEDLPTARQARAAAGGPLVVEG